MTPLPLNGMSSCVVAAERGQKPKTGWQRDETSDDCNFLYGVLGFCSVLFCWKFLFVCFCGVLFGFFFWLGFFYFSLL